jgi:antibiotic biosynthesis monooxygenase (ABM) superfamily enzyme
MNLPGNKDKPAGAVAVLTSRTVRPGLEERFEAALHEFISDSLHEDGQLGVHVVRPVPGSGSREYGILRRFSDQASRDRFYSSPLFREWEKTVAPLTEGEPARQELSGLETWFTLPGQRAIVPPPRWKMAIVTVVGVYPASLLVPWLLNPVIAGLPVALQALFIAVGIVTILTWVIMPFLAKVLSPWLNRS